MIEEAHRHENKKTDITPKIEEQMEINITITIKTINSIETERQNDDPPGIDENTSDSSNEDQEILDKFYNANEDTCNTVINTLESNPTWILPMYQCTEFEQEFTKQKTILENDFLLDSGATLSLLNEVTWNEIKYNNPDIHLERANKTLTAANNTTIETFGTVTLNLTPDRTSNNRNKPQHNFNIYFYVNKQLTSNLFGKRQTIADEIDNSDPEDSELRFGNLLQPSVNQNVSRNYQNLTQYIYNRNNTYISSFNDKHKQQELYWEQQMYNYKELKDEITEKVTNHPNKLIDNIENKLRQINENIERRQEEELEMVFDKLERTLDNINRQNNLRSEKENPDNNRNPDTNNIKNYTNQNNRH